MDYSKIKCVIFDFDGVIADTDTSRYAIMQDLLLPYGFDFQKQFKIEQLVGKSTSAFLKQYYSQIPEDERKKLALNRQTMYVDDLNKYCKTYHGAVDTLRKLKESGKDLRLATANDKWVVDKVLIHLQISDCFSKIYYKEVTENEQGNKDYSNVKNAIEYAQNQCVVVEDSPVGVAGAKRAGYYCMAFNHFNIQEISQSADVVIQSFADLKSLILGMENR